MYKPENAHVKLTLPEFCGYVLDDPHKMRDVFASKKLSVMADAFYELVFQLKKRRYAFSNILK